MNKALMDVAWDWACRCFGDQMADPAARALRLAEEAVELAQSAGVPRWQLDRLVGVVYDKPIGEMKDEARGVVLTTALFCRMNDWEPDDLLLEAVRKALEKDPKYWGQRNDAKDKLGLTGSDQK